jgi:hypothetical protein
LWYLFSLTPPDYILIKESSISTTLYLIDYIKDSRTALVVTAAVGVATLVSTLISTSPNALALADSL